MRVSSPKFINPWRFADAGASVQGEVPVSFLTRLATLLRNDSGAATYELSFALDERRQPVVTGRIAAVVDVTCQRCLEPMRLQVASDICIGIVRSAEEAASALLEAMIVEDNRLSLAALVEEELILALPSAPLHPAGECRAPSYVGAAETVVDGGANRPFAELSKLKPERGGRSS